MVSERSETRLSGARRHAAAQRLHAPSAGAAPELEAETGGGFIVAYNGRVGNCLVGWWVSGWLVGWWVGGWLVGWWLFGWLVGEWVVGWLVGGWVVGWLVGGWLVGWLAG